MYIYKLIYKSANKLTSPVTIRRKGTCYVAMYNFFITLIKYRVDILVIS